MGGPAACIQAVLTVCERAEGSGASRLRILTLQGADADGEPYTFDFAVRDNGEVAEATYWRTLKMRADVPPKVAVPNGHAVDCN